MTPNLQFAFDAFIKANPNAILVGSAAAELHKFPLRRPVTDLDFYMQSDDSVITPTGFQVAVRNDYYYDDDTAFKRFDFEYVFDHELVKINVFASNKPKYDKDYEFVDGVKVTKLTDILTWKLKYSARTKKHFDDVAYALNYLIRLRQDTAILTKY